MLHQKREVIFGQVHSPSKKIYSELHPGRAVSGCGSSSSIVTIYGAMCEDGHVCDLADVKEFDVRAATITLTASATPDSYRGNGYRGAACLTSTNTDTTKPL